MLALQHLRLLSLLRTWRTPPHPPPPPPRCRTARPLVSWWASSARTCAPRRPPVPPPAPSTCWGRALAGCWPWRLPQVGGCMGGRVGRRAGGWVGGCLRGGRGWRGRARPSSLSFFHSFRPAPFSNPITPSPHPLPRSRTRSRCRAASAGGPGGASEPRHLLPPHAVASGGPAAAPGARGGERGGSGWGGARSVSACCGPCPFPHPCVDRPLPRPLPPPSLCTAQVPQELYRGLPLLLAPVLGNPINLLASALSEPGGGGPRGAGEVAGALVETATRLLSQLPVLAEILPPGGWAGGGCSALHACWETGGGG